jgi:drug/metabolite transporter (DMT)-like permease
MHATRTASLALVIGGAMWGIYWIPVRFFLERGLSGPWPGIAMYAATLLVLLPALWSERGNIRANWHALILSGMCTGAALSLYTTSLVYTEVARSILLFYLTPLWGTALGLIFLGERLSLGRVLGLIFGLGGLFVVLGDQGLPWPRNIGDWLALSSGIMWAVGSMGMYRTKKITLKSQLFAFVLGALILALIGSLFLDAAPPKGLGPLLPLILLSSIYVLPMIVLTIWPATLLSPARVGIFLMSEVLVGLASAAWLSGEHFGLREGIGAILIVSAGVFEVARAERSPG